MGEEGSPGGKSIEERTSPHPLAEGWDLSLAGGRLLLCVSCTLQMPSGGPCVDLMGMFWGWGHGVDKSGTIPLLGSWEDKCYTHNAVNALIKIHKGLIKMEKDCGGSGAQGGPSEKGHLIQNDRQRQPGKQAAGTAGTPGLAGAEPPGERSSPGPGVLAGGGGCGQGRGLRAREAERRGLRSGVRGLPATA